MDWETTRVLNGEVGDFVTIARRERGGDDWYPGSVTDEAPCTLEVALDFLDPGRSCTARIYRDGEHADYRSRREDILIGTRQVTAADPLQLRPAPGGGPAIRFVAR